MKKQQRIKYPTRLFLSQYIFLLFSFTFCSFSLKAKTPNESDKMYVHLDKGFYVAGERMQFTIFQSNKFLNQSIHLKISLIDASAHIIHTQFIATQGRLRQSNFIDLPFQLTSDYYNLVVQVFDLPTNAIINLAEIPIPVYSDFEPIPKNIQPLQKAAFLKKEQLNISLKTRNPNVAKRSKVEPIIQVKDKRGRFVKADISMSVSDLTTNAGFENLFLFKIPYDCTYLGNTPFFEGVLKQKFSLKSDQLKALLPEHRATTFTKINCGDQTIMTIQLNDLATAIQFDQSYILYDSLVFTPLKNIELKYTDPKKLIYNDVIVQYLEASKIRRKINLHYQIPPNSNVISNEKPFFTTQLFWKSGEYTRFKTNQPSFYFQSDDRSEFQIELVARDESGNIGRKKVVYTVY